MTSFLVQMEQRLRELGVTIYSYWAVCSCGWMNEYRSPMKEASHQLACPTCGALQTLLFQGEAQ